MNVELKKWQGNENLYFYPQSSQIAGQTGLIGKLRADFDTDGNGFFSSWDDIRGYLKTDEFKTEFDAVMNYLRFDAPGTPIASRNALAAFLKGNDNALLPNDGSWHGFRADTEKFSYLFRLKAEKGDYNIYCYCYRRDWLDGHMANANRGIRFITPDYDNLFALPDGGKIRIIYQDGEMCERTCRYIDEYHVEIGNGSCNLYHICEFAERMERAGAKIEPVDEPISLITANYYCPLTLSVWERNEYGDLDNYSTDFDGKYCARYEYEIKELCEAEHSIDGCDGKSMASYQDNPKVRSVVFDVKAFGDTLYGCIKCELTAPLTAAEDAAFKSWLTGQCSDGFGEGLEQREFEIDDGLAAVSFWSSNNYFMKNENEFRDYLSNPQTMKFGGM